MKNQLLEKVHAVLETLVAARKPMSMSELADALKMPLATVSRICCDLIEMGMIEKTDYHHLIPGSTLIRFGSQAANISPLLHFSEKKIRDFAAKTGLNALLYGYEKEIFFKIFSCARNYSDGNAFWRTGAFQVLLASAGKDQKNAFAEINRFFPLVTTEEKLIIEREYEKVIKEKTLVRVGINRFCAITVPLFYRNIFCALSFYGQMSKDNTPEKLIFDSLRMVSQIRAALYRSGMIKDESE